MAQFLAYTSLTTSEALERGAGLVEQSSKVLEASGPGVAHGALEWAQRSLADPLSLSPPTMDAANDALQWAQRSLGDLLSPPSMEAFTAQLPSPSWQPAAALVMAAFSDLTASLDSTTDAQPALVLLLSSLTALALSTVAGAALTDALPSVYDPAASSRYFARRPSLLWARQTSLLNQLATFLLALLKDHRSGQWDANQPLRAAELRALIVAQGAAFIKVGQGLAIRPDILPPAYLTEFAKLLDQVPPFEAVEAQAALRAALAAKGCAPPEELFEDMNVFQTPVAAASIGQVYRAVLRPGAAPGVTQPTTVAVKLQRPDILASVSLDLHIIRQSVVFLAQLPAGATRMGRIAKQAQGFLEVLDTAALRFLEELQYEQEAANSVRFATLMAASGTAVRDAIKVPEVFTALSSNGVLVQEWIDGVKLSDIPRDTEEGRAQCARLVRSLLLSYMVQLLETGFLHADPHPGNFLLMADGRVAILDFGMVTEITQEQRIAFLEYVAHLSAKQYDQTIDDLVNLGFVPSELAADPAKRAIVAPAIASTLDILYGSGGGLSEAKVDALKAQSRVAALSEELKSLSRQYPVTLPPYFILILRAFGTLEGLGIGVDNNFAVLDETFPYIAHRLLTDDSPRVRAALKTFAFGSSDRLSAERVEAIATGFRTFGATLDNSSRAVTPRQPAGPLQLDAGTRQLLSVLFSVEGNYVQSLVIQEAVRAVDALSRDALVAIWAALAAASPALAPARTLLGPAAFLLPGFPLISLADTRPVRLTEEDAATLATLRSLAALMVPLPAQARPGAASMQLDVRAIVDSARAVAPLMPTIAPGLAAMGERFVRLLAARMLARAAEDLAGVAASVGPAPPAPPRSTSAPPVPLPTGR